MRTRAFGPRALLAEVSSAREAAALAAWVRGRLDCEEVVPAARTVLLDGVDPRAARATLEQWPGGTIDPAARSVEVPVAYDAQDLSTIAERWGVDVAEVVRRHTSLVFTSAFCGFAPGFAYLAGLPQEWRLPRLADPRPRVPAGSVALAGEWCGVYPTASPGGWLLLGTTSLRLWDPSAEEPALLAPGTQVRFVVA